MSKDELRPCVVKINKVDGETEAEYTEVHNALFHMWEAGLAVVEYEDGKIHFANPRDITFTDRN